MDIDTILYIIVNLLVLGILFFVIKIYHYVKKFDVENKHLSNTDKHIDKLLVKQTFISSIIIISYVIIFVLYIGCVYCLKKYILDIITFDSINKYMIDSIGLFVMVIIAMICLTLVFINMQKVIYKRFESVEREISFIKLKDTFDNKSNEQNKINNDIH